MKRQFSGEMQENQEVSASMGTDAAASEEGRSREELPEGDGTDCKGEEPAECVREQLPEGNGTGPKGKEPAECVCEQFPEEDCEDDEIDSEEEWDGDLDEDLDGEERKGFLKNEYARGVLTGILCCVIFLAGCLTSWLIGEREGHRNRLENGAEVLTSKETQSKLKQIRALIEDKYLNEVDGDLLESYLFKGIAAGLDDPYSNYYSQEEMQDLMESDRGEYVGIGVTLRKEEAQGEYIVSEVYEDTPAQRAGIEPGDLMRKVEDEDLTARELEEISDLIREQGDRFVLTVYRPKTGEELEVELQCEKIEMKMIEYEMLTDEIGYIRIVQFKENAVTQFKEAAAALQQEGMEKLIVDVRGNPGGLLDSVLGILDEILPERLLVWTEDREGHREEYYSDRKRMLDCEIAVLVDGDSASASEIFAGAIQDYGIGPVIGTKTYGKGVVQKTYTLSDGSAFKLTVETYYTPLGQEIDGNGITPDLIVEETQEKESSGKEAFGEENSGEERSEKETSDKEASGEEGEDPVLKLALEALSGAS